jgi:hypothetical protein
MHRLPSQPKRRRPPPLPSRRRSPASTGNSASRRFIARASAACGASCRAGPGDFEVRLRYGWLAQEARERGLDLAGSLIVLERCRQANARHDRAVRLWASSFRLLNRETIFALRLVLRLLRRHAPTSFADVIEAMTTLDWRHAAE